MNSTNKHELAVELIGTTFQDIIGASLRDFPDTPLTLEIFDKMEEYMARGSYEAFYFRILSEKSKPYRRGIFFEVARYENGLYSLHISFDW